jgi:hypothetical protein
MRSAVSLIVAVYLSSSHYNFLGDKQGVIDLGKSLQISNKSSGGGQG